MGLYPEVTSVGGFAVGSPLFASIALGLSGRHTFQIDAPGASDYQPYVQRLTFDGSPVSGLRLPWTNVQNGATLGFTLGSIPSSWGSGPQDAPPSYPSRP